MLRTATRGSQYPLVAEFTFNFDDTMVNVAGALDGFATVGSHVFEVINLPRRHQAAGFFSSP